MADTDYGFEAFLARQIADAGGERMSGSDNAAGFVFTKGRYKGKNKAQIIDAARQEYAAMDPAARMEFENIGNNRDIRPNAVAVTEGGTSSAITQPNAGNPGGITPTGPGLPAVRGTRLGRPMVNGASPTAESRSMAMQSQQDQAVKQAKANVQAVRIAEGVDPSVSVDKEIAVNDARKASMGIQDTGGGTAVMRNKYGSGTVTRRVDGQPATPGKFFDEKGQVDLPASSAAGTTKYVKDSTGNTAMRPTTPEFNAATAPTANSLIAGADTARAADRSAAVGRRMADPAWNANRGLALNSGAFGGKPKPLSPGMAPSAAAVTAPPSATQITQRLRDIPRKVMGAGPKLAGPAPSTLGPVKPKSLAAL